MGWLPPPVAHCPSDAQSRRNNQGVSEQVVLVRHSRKGRNDGNCSDLPWWSDLRRNRWVIARRGSNESKSYSGCCISRVNSPVNRGLRSQNGICDERIV